MPQLERSANANLIERCSSAEQRLEASESRNKSLTNQLRDVQEGRFQVERHVKAVSEKLERLKADADRMEDENAVLKVT